MPSLGIARTMEVASTYIPCRRMVRHRFQASFRRVRVFTERRLDFKQSSLCHITRVPSRTPSMPSQGRDFPGMLLSRPPFDFGLPSDPGTILQVPPNCAGDTTERLHGARYTPV